MRKTASIALNAQDRVYRAHAARRARDNTDPLKRLTRAELIRIISKLETQTPINLRQAGVHSKAASGHVPTLVVNGPVRSGQTVTFEEGDLIIVGSVGSGAEIVAGGSIHVYGALRGRAYAGTSDLFGGRIFCQKLEAELLAIGPICRMSDALDSNLRGRPAHAWRAANELRLGALDKLEGVETGPEHIEAVASLGSNQPASEEPQGIPSSSAKYVSAERFRWARPLSWLRRLSSTRCPQRA
jgi:septum site-determining protein MinC